MQKRGILQYIAYHLPGPWRLFIFAPRALPAACARDHDIMG